jgi:uncharacterized protein (DUF433 family)
MADTDRLIPAATRPDAADRVRDLEAAERLIEIDPETMGGEPVFKGSRITVRAVIARLGAGEGPASLLESFPGLDHRKLDLARVWATAHPSTGRAMRLSDFGFRLKATTRVALPADPLADAPAEADGAILI